MRLRPIKRKEENLRNIKRKKDCGKRVQKPTLKKKWSVVSINGQDVLEVRRTFPCEREDTLATSFFFYLIYMNVGERTTTSPIVVVGNLRCVTFSPNIFLSLSPLTKRFLIRNNLFIFWLLKCFVFLPSWLLFVFNGIFFCHSIRWPFEVILEESRIFLGFTRLAGKDIILQVVLCWIIARKIRILRDLDIQIKNRIHSTDWRWRNDSGSFFFVLPSRSEISLS